MTESVPSLAPYLEHVRVSAFRLETRRRYALTYEAGMFRDFVQDRPIGDPSEAAWFRPWLDMIRVSKARWQRVRIVDEPPTDYQRFAALCSDWNTAAGEDIRHLTRALAREEAIPDDEDWWVFDDATVIRLVFDDADDIDHYELVSGGQIGPYLALRDRALSLASGPATTLPEAI